MPCLGTRAGSLSDLSPGCFYLLDFLLCSAVREVDPETTPSSGVGAAAASSG